MKKCVVRIALLVCAFASSQLANAAAIDCPPPAGADPKPRFDATLLKEGRFIYHTTLKGESLGETAIEVRRVGSRFVISMSAPKIRQSWESTFARSFAPLSASLQMQGRKGPYAMELKYSRAKVTGIERDAEGTRPVKATAAGVVVDQRVDWASIMAATAPAGSGILLQVFDPSTGSSPMLGKLGGTQPLQGAWGKIDAVRLDYTICKRDHLEEYTVYATRETPRYMLREDMPNGLVSELIRIEL
jgi:hypothetical protein